jgi:predicted O-linked N-acetylglucosamine transferase (SPINDLY family)
MNANLQTLAEQAVSLHRRGELAQAEALYLQILAADPALYGPRYYMGMLRLQQGRFAEACDYLGQAIKVFPDDLGTVMNYGVALRAAGRPQEAVTAFDKALTIQPNMADAFYNRGVAQGDLQRFEQALESYDRALVLQPNFVLALINRGVALASLNRFDDALDSQARALALEPGNVLALNNRGLSLRATGRFDDALACYDRALAGQPGYPDAAYNRGVVLLDLKRYQDALDGFEPLLAVRPNDAELFNNRGVALWNLNRPAEALASYERALAVEPDFVPAWANRGLALRDLGRYPEALASYERVLALDPRSAVGWNSRGNVLRDMRRYEDAIESYDRAIAIRPDYAEAIVNRGYARWSSKDHDAGLADVARGLALDPAYPHGLGELLHMRMILADWRDFAALTEKVRAGVQDGKRIAQPFIFQPVSDSPAELQACARLWAQDRYPQIASAPPHDPAARRANRKIRIGYVSGEFREQATALLMAGLYEKHDRDAFEIVALDNSVDDASPMRARLQKTFDKWIPIRALSDQEAAARIRAEEIDILVNLNGYFGEVRMGVFAWRPAPLQVNYLGFPGTLGAPYMNYLIADRIVIPENEQAFFDETVVYLPGSYQANDDRGRALAAIPGRAEAGLPETGFVFCNFNHPYKLTPATFDGWMRILEKTPGSVLWLLEGTPSQAGNLRREAAARGVAPERLVFAADLPTDQHLARLSLADLFLDSLPYNAHTTGSDALWTGVPLVSLRGHAFAGRVAASLLTAAGLPDLIAETQADYEALAIRLATDPQALKKIKARLARNKASCALFDTAAFTKNIEAAYRQMWQAWLAGEAPKPFAVKA